MQVFPPHFALDPTTGSMAIPHNWYNQKWSVRFCYRKGIRPVATGHQARRARANAVVETSFGPSRGCGVTHRRLRDLRMAPPNKKAMASGKLPPLSCQLKVRFLFPVVHRPLSPFCSWGRRSRLGCEPGAYRVCPFARFCLTWGSDGICSGMLSNGCTVRRGRVLDFHFHFQTPEGIGRCIPCSMTT